MRLNGEPSVSVIIPIRNGREFLPLSVRALEASDLERSKWELLIVDDGSSDGSADWALEYADRVTRVEGGPRGPGFARNLGAAQASGDVLVFVDADVCVHPDVLRRFQELFASVDGLGAAFGTYDERPQASQFLSQYRNLYHRYVHVLGAGEAQTFWAGCGAVRKDLFLRLEGFDAERYPRPQIEDIELGYRVRAAGYTILLDPRIEGTHLKRWRFREMVKSDLLDRGVPWMKLLLGDGPGGKAHGTLGVSRREKVKTALMGLSCLMVSVGLALSGPRLILAGLAPVGLIVLMNLPVYSWFADRRGWWFAVRVVPLNLLHYVISGLAAMIALSAHVLRPGRPGTA